MFVLGAFGYFEVTHDITKYCKAAVFSKIGKKTPIGVRFSTVGKNIIINVSPDFRNTSKSDCNSVYLMRFMFI